MEATAGDHPAPEPGSEPRSEPASTRAITPETVSSALVYVNLYNSKLEKSKTTDCVHIENVLTGKSLLNI